MWFWSTLARRFASSHSASSSRMAKRWRPGQSAGSSIFTNQFVTLLVIFVPYDTVCWVQIWGGTCGAQVRHPGVVRGLFWDPQWRWPQCPMHWKCQWPCQKVDFELKNKSLPLFFTWHGNAAIRYPDSVLVRENMKAYVSKSDDIETIQEKSRTINVGEVNTPRPLFL